MMSHHEHITRHSDQPSNIFSCPQQLNRTHCPLLGLTKLTIRVFTTLQSRAGPQSQNQSDQQNTSDPTGSIHKKARESLTPKKLILIRGIAFEKNGPCSWENEVKISKKRKMAKKHFSRADFANLANLRVPENCETTFQYKLAPKTP